MPIEILMPALSPTMTEGNLAKWNVKEGDKIKSGQVIAEIETDKATMEVEAVDEGVIGKIMIPAGTEAVKVNQLIALLLEEGEDKKVLDGYQPKAALAAPAKPAEKPAEAQQAAPSVGVSQVVSAAPMAATGTGGRVFASPLAKRIAANEGVQLQLVQGSGPHGRVVKEDVLKFVQSGGAAKGRVVRSAV